MKMISLDDIIEYCDNERAAYKANNCGAACTALRRLEEFAKEYAVEAEPVNGWISVDDRLPEPETWVMVYIKYPSPVFELERGIQKMNSIKKMFYDGKSFYCDFGTITHWQPLPSTEGLNEA